MIYFGHVKPYRDRVENRLMILNELNIDLISIVFVLFIDP